MALYSNRPFLYDKATEQALDAMRSGDHLDAAHPLQLFLNVQAALVAPSTLRGGAAVQIAIFEHLKNVITERLESLRQPYHLPRPDACTESHLVGDFQQSNAELEAWSLLYHRYICVDRGWSMQQLAALTRQDARTLRRRHRAGISRMTTELITREQQARQRDTNRRLRLALPVSIPPALYGVESSLATALHILTTGDSPCHLVLHGPTGIGKTVLAQAVAHHLIEAQQLDDLLWFDLPDAVPSQTSLVHMLIDRLGLFHTADDNPVWALRAYLLSHRTLIILDGADALLEMPEAAGSLMAVLDAAVLVLTSEVLPPPSLWCYTLTLPGLSHDQALLWLSHALPDRSDRGDSWQDRFEQVWEMVGGNPLLLRTLLELSRTLPLDSALAQLDPLYEQIWQGLSPDERKLCLLGLLFARKGIHYEQIEQLSRLNTSALDVSLLTLTRHGLWSVSVEHDVYTYRSSRLFSSFLSRYMLNNPIFFGETSLPVVLNRLLRRAGDLLVESPDPETALDLVRYANAWRVHGIEIWEYINQLSPQITHAGLWLGWYEQLSLLLESESDSARVGWLYQMAGTALRWLGRINEAGECLDRALTFYRRVDHAGQADVFSERAVVRRYQGRLLEAYNDVQSALEIYTSFGQTQGIERCLHELAQLCLENGDAEHALDWLERLDRWQLRSWGIAGQAYVALGQLDRAREAAAQVEHHLAIGLPAQGRTAASLGLIYDALDETDRAIAHFRLAMGLLERSKDMLGYARTCNNLAVAYLKQPPERREETLDEIRQQLREVEHIQEQIGDPIGLAITRQNLVWLAAGERGSDS